MVRESKFRWSTSNDAPLSPILSAARPIIESEVKLQWSADERTRQAIAAVLAGNEEDTVVTDDCRLVCGHEAYDLSRLAGGRRFKIVCYPVEQKVF